MRETAEGGQEELSPELFKKLDKVESAYPNMQRPTHQVCRRGVDTVFLFADKEKVILVRVTRGAEIEQPQPAATPPTTASITRGSSNSNQHSSTAAARKQIEMTHVFCTFFFPPQFCYSTQTATTVHYAYPTPVQSVSVTPRTKQMQAASSITHEI